MTTLTIGKVHYNVCLYNVSADLHLKAPNRNLEDDRNARCQDRCKPGTETSGRSRTFATSGSKFYCANLIDAS
jgi:hypothetical protein